MANSAIVKDTSFHVGDTVRVHQTIKEGDKSRIQIFEGIVIAIKGSGDPTFIVRKIASDQIAVERIYPINTPIIAKLEVKKTGFTRKAKLYHLRDRVGKSATKIRAAKQK